MGEDTERRRREGVREWARLLAPYLLAALGVGGAGLYGASEVKEQSTTDNMLEQHTEALRERVDYLEEWIVKHRKSHMDE